MSNYIRNFLLLITTLLSVSSLSPSLAQSPEKQTPSKSYSYQTSSLQNMERELRAMQQSMIIRTPEVNPKTALPAIIVNSSSDEEDAEEFTPKLSFFLQLTNAAKQRTEHTVRYDGSYRYIKYPMGDVAPNMGVCTDVVIRSYRKLDIDLQELVHEDMRRHFRLYPSQSKWGLAEPDPNIDHRRVYNLQVFFKRFGKSLPISANANNYQPGDLVTWQISPKLPHIGIVVDAYSDDGSQRPLIVHNIGEGPKQEDILFSFPITGHYRFKPGMKKIPTATPPFQVLTKNNHAKPSSDTLNLEQAALVLLP